jgi:hypothetical protein
MMLAGAGVLLFAATLGIYLSSTRSNGGGLPVALPAPPPIEVELDAGAVPVVAPVAAVLVPEGVDAGAAEVKAKDVPTPKRFPRPPADELAKLAELEALIQERRFAEAVVASDRANRMELSTVGMSYAAMLSTKASCGRKDQGAAQTRFRTITEPSHRTAAKSFCAGYIDPALLTY